MDPRNILDLDLQTTLPALGGAIVVCGIAYCGLRILKEEKGGFNANFGLLISLSALLYLTVILSGAFSHAAIGFGAVISFVLFAIANTLLFFFYDHRFKRSTGEPTSLADYSIKPDTYFLSREEEKLHRKARIALGWGYTGVAFAFAIGGVLHLVGVD